MMTVLAILGIIQVKYSVLRVWIIQHCVLFIIAASLEISWVVAKVQFLIDHYINSKVAIDFKLKLLHHY